jgi:hypothetical protein
MDVQSTAASTPPPQPEHKQTVQSQQAPTTATQVDAGLEAQQEIEADDVCPYATTYSC